ncbi:alpha-xylosidase [Phototrophicus methaneseepsis]|uniref:alpha-D-xyloside xylohydrolase n=1 Tax=Phototrophicus methaneseepsis TaxID=2710758 RepID=A0A7S8EAK8_9CHLR|nr:alpha-xylosidase [Phototrophicus methaneseepsis]QPC83440.1 alpha-xylosidase [Phototrophicus methaneseepsis]
MKFEEGLWRLLPDVEAIYPRTITHVSTEGDALTVSGYDHEIWSRASYLHGTLITVRFTAPMPDVIRVQIKHFKGRKPRLPEFDLDYEQNNTDVEVGSDENESWLKSGGLTLRVPNEGNWHYSFYRDGALLTQSEMKALGLFQKQGHTYMRDQLSLQVGEMVYGLGERFASFVKNGQSVDIWNEDGGTMSEYAYKNVPFYLSSQGYGVLVNNPGRVSFEVASHHVSRVQFSTEGHELDYYIFGGPTMKDALDQYTALSGRPPVLPEWSYGLWLTTSFTTNYNEVDIMANIERMEASGIPISVFHFDCFWMRELAWVNFIWDERNFPDPEGMLRRIKEKGIKVCVWINPYVAEDSEMFEEGQAQGYFLQTQTGDVYQVDHWQPGMAFVDFTNPDATDWYCGKLKDLLDMGVDCFKTDFGERIPDDAVYHNGADPVRMHNYYTYLYNQAVFDLLVRERGEGEAVLFARSATAGGQQFPVHWGGDNSSTYPSMAETLRGGLSLGLSGFGYWSHDISGFNDTASPDLYKRWVAFGLLSSHSRLHGASSARMPWLFDEEAVDVLRFYNRLKQQLMPYLMETAQESQQHGWPMLRAMILEYPEDPTCRYLDTQYMLGASLLVAPIFNPQGDVTYYLPAGEWRHLLTGELATGGSWRTEHYDYFGLPLWVRTAQCPPSLANVVVPEVAL